jgi:transposase
MELITILNRCHRSRVFVYQHAHLQCRQEEHRSRRVPLWGWEPYLKLIRENCSEALHILDRFHIVANMNKALDNVRAEETSRMRREGRAPTIRKSR